MQNYSYSESNFENAVIELFENAGYIYSCGYDIHRTNEEILLIDDFKEYLDRRYSSLKLREDEVESVIRNLLFIRGTSLYPTAKLTINELRKGFTLERKQYGLKSELIEYFDFSNVNNNLFKVVNQFEVKGYETRRPDVVIFINGIPVSVIELKNLSVAKVKLFEAYEQVCVRYARDIENLMRFSFISVISDGVNTKCGSLFADYKHFYPWKSADGINYSKDGIDSLISLINGLFNKETLLNVLHHYIYFPDNSKKEAMILPKYSQYYASEMLYKNIKAHMRPKGDGKGGTYFGATGCGKSYTMLFLSRRLATSSELHNPTIVLLTDRNDLDDQLSQTFENSKEYLVDSNTINVPSRDILNKKVRGVSSGGVFLLTVQKFNEEIGLLSDRTNIICISDEAHRTQVNLDVKLDIDENDGIKKRYGFATYLRESFPNATYVGFTGTPIDATINVFGPVTASYKMKQSVDDGSTVAIDLLPGPSNVKVDEAKLKIIDKYYADRLKEGTNKYEVDQSIRDLATVRTIIDNDSRIDIIVKHFIDHYEMRLAEGSTVRGKAMFVCYDRKIAYKVYKKIIKLRPEWNIKKKTQEDESKLSYEQLNRLKPVEMVKLVATSSPNDEKELFDLLGNADYRSGLATLFKDENSNFKIAIVVDMWITGFDCECLDTMYIDKPLERHSLIQTISRVNRVFEGKDKGLIVDYIGIEASLAKAMQLYSGDINPVKEIDASLTIFKDQLQLINELMHGFDASKFEKGTDLERLLTLNKAIEFVQTSNDRETRFMSLTLRMKKAFDLCVGDSRISEKEMIYVHLYCAIRSAILKTTTEGTPDAERMNQEVRKLVDASICAMDIGETAIKKTEIFSDVYLKKIQDMPYKNTKFKLLLQLLRKAIKKYGKTNKLKALEFSEKMKKVVDKYNNRDNEILISNDDVINDFIDSLSKEAKKILDDIKEDSETFKKMGISFEEKAFYDILKMIRDKYKFAFSEEKLVYLSKKVKEIVDDKAKYTDWSSKSNIRASLQSDVIRLLNKNGYPPQTFEEVYDKVLAQIENFKQYHD